MKILCICDFGNNRSGAMSLYIKSLNGDYIDFIQNKKENEIYIKYEVINIGVCTSTKQTMKLMCNWADKVLDLSSEGNEIYIKSFAKKKYFRIDVGIDRFHSNSHPELIDICKNKLQEIDLNE